MARPAPKIVDPKTKLEDLMEQFDKEGGWQLVHRLVWGISFVYMVCNDKADDGARQFTVSQHAEDARLVADEFIEIVKP